ncbi:MAG: hypothetical protein ACFFBP_06455 [Promethearchaeota archaeon]
MYNKIVQFRFDERIGKIISLEHVLENFLSILKLNPFTKVRFIQYE